MTEILSDEWLDAVVEASTDRAGLGGTRVVAITVGKSKRAVFEIAHGQVKPRLADDEAGVTIPVTAKQLEAILDGSESLAQAFMRGDVKPEGATGPLLAAVELFEDATFRQRLAALV